MAEQHPDLRLLECFLRNDLSGEECRVVVRHLLTGCPQCVAVTRRVWSLADGRGPDLFERILRTGAAREREAARERSELK